MMRKSLVLAMLVVIAGGSVYAWKAHEPKSVIVPAKAAPAVKTERSAISFPADAPQLDYLKTVVVTQVPEPAVEPLPARVTMDDDRTARIYPPVNGRVLRIFAEPGVPVKKGQPLIEIDAPDYATALSDVRKAQADSNLKQRTYARQKDLEQAGVIARKELESAQSDLTQSHAELERANSRLRQLAPNGGSSATLTLRAPMDGIITDRQVTPGTEIRPDSTTPLFVISDTRHLWILMDVPEAATSRLHAGQSVSITSDSNPTLLKKGTIANIPAVVDANTHRLTVRVVIDNPDGDLRPEMLVRALPYADSGKLVTRVPNTALVTVGYFTYAFVEKNQGTFERRRVNVVIAGHGESFVDSGLQAGDKVVSTGALLLDSEMRSGD